MRTEHHRYATRKGTKGRGRKQPPKQLTRVLCPCGEEFMQKRSLQRYCSENCNNHFSNKRVAFENVLKRKGLL